MTKDERFLVKLYELTLEAEDASLPHSSIRIGELIGIGPKGVKTICNLLAQANFIKKQDSDAIILTPQGKNLAEQLV